MEFLGVLGHDPSLPIVDSPSSSSPSSDAWTLLRAAATTCTQCSLSQNRTHVVFGEGSTTSSFMFVGEAPGKGEDQSGNPFTGEAGQLLSKMIAAMGLSRETVYITNVIKCMPPNNRNPLAEETQTCSSYLKKQIQLLRPKWIIALGTFAAQHLLASEQSIALLRGRLHTDHKWFRDDNEREVIKIIPTFHPTYLLNNPEMKKACWEDLQLVMQDAGLMTKA